jgi:hypothetical protein
MDEQKIAYCGLTCSMCPILIATFRNDNILRQKVFVEWSELYREYFKDQGMGNLKLEDMSCRGCRSDGGQFKGCTICVIRKCCQEKNLESCAYCRDYEKCEALNGFYSIPEHKPAKDYLDRIRSRC